MHYHLFVLCPPYSGSTVLWKLLATSANVSALPSEGQFLPELRDIMRAHPWQADKPLPWPHIRSVWQSYWDHGKPVLLEKSPPNLLHTRAIREHFAPVRFVIMVRDPYAHAEGLMRRNGWKAQRAARFSLMCLRTQRQNADTLDDALAFTYESLVADPAAVTRRLKHFLPELADMDHTASFNVHSLDGTVDRPITDLNARKIAALAPEVMDTLNAVFATEVPTLAAWGYSLRSGL